MEPSNLANSAMGHPQGQTGPGPREVQTEAAPVPVGPYSQGVVASGPFLFAAGQVGLDPKTGKLAGKMLPRKLGRRC